MMNDLKEFGVTPWEIDYINFAGDVLHVDAFREEHNDLILELFKSFGVEIHVNNRSKIYGVCIANGMRVTYDKYYRAAGNEYTPKILIQVPGLFFIYKDSEKVIRNLLKSFKDVLAVYLKITRVDFKRDIIGAKHPFDYFPFFKKGGKTEWHLRSKPTYTEYFNNGEDKPFTGFSVSNSRYKLSSYDKQLQLESVIKKKMRREPQFKNYYKFYKDKFKNNPVQRLELSLKEDACKTFNLLFVNSEWDLKKVITVTMSKWARTHALKSVGPKRKKDWDIDPVFRELFHFDEYSDYKHFRELFFVKYEMKISDFTFSEGRKTLEDLCRSVAKKICYIHEDLGTPTRELIDMAKGHIITQCAEFSGIKDEKKSQFEKSLNFMGMTSQGLMDKRLEILKIRPEMHFKIA